MNKQFSININFKHVMFRISVVMAMILLFTASIDGKKRTRKTVHKTTTTQTAMNGFAARWYEKAMAGNAEAQAWLAESYEWGMGVKIDYQKTMEWAQRASDQGNPLGTWRIGNLHGSGSGVDKNETVAYKWYKKAYEQASIGVQSNDAMSQLVMGIFYYYGYWNITKNKEEAIKWYRKAAEQGNMWAQHMMGACYWIGDGIAEDDLQAAEWYRKAAEQEYANSQYCLGKMYSNGDGVSKDDSEAVKWWRKAAEQGHANAQYYLGTCYDFGNGVAVNHIEAVKWYKKAAEQNNASAQWNLYCSYSDGEGVAKNTKIAKEWLQKAADNGHEEAQNTLQDVKRQSIIDEIGSDTFYKLEDGSFYIGMNWNTFLKYAKNVSMLSSQWSSVVAEPNQWLTSECMRLSSASDRAKYQGAVVWEVKFHQRNTVYDYNYMVIVKNGKVFEWSLQ